MPGETTAVCPSCGSGKVVEGITSASCSECGWTGKPKQLLQAPLSVAAGGGSNLVLDVSHPDHALALLQQVSENLMGLIYQNASKPLGLAILTAGIVGKKDTQNIARLIRAACRAAHKAVLNEAEEIAKESKTARAGAQS